MDLAVAHVVFPPKVGFIPGDATLYVNISSNKRLGFDVSLRKATDLEERTEAGCLLAESGGPDSSSQLTDDAAKRIPNGFTSIH